MCAGNNTTISHYAKDGRSMVRGVNRFTVEIKETKSPYFERAICFVKPEYAVGGGIDLHRAAMKMVCDIDSDIDPRLCTEKKRGGRLFALISGLLLGIAGGLAAGYYFL